VHIAKYEEDEKYINNSGLKIHLKNTDEGALHFCILFLWTLSIVPVFLNKTQRFRDWLCLRPQVIKEGQEGGDPIWWVP
jgi:hypothetical protein